MSFYRNNVKRAFDIAFSISVLFLSSPLLVMIILLIKASSKGPIFYASKRLGKNQKEISCYKFRSMCVNADEKLQEVLAKDENLKTEWEKFRKLKNDPRITLIGKFLRKTSLDEFPQFWNVVIGDLSIVGPRPAFAEEVEKFYGKKAGKILSVRPGLTGIWQTSGRNLLTFEERVVLEEKYVEEHTFVFDLKLIFKTVPLMIFPKGAF